MTERERLALDDQLADEEETYTAWDEDEEEDEPEPPRMSSREAIEAKLEAAGVLQSVEVVTGRDVVKDALQNPDLEAETGMDPVSWCRWITSLSPAAFASAAEAAGQPGATQPRFDDLPIEIQAAVAQADLDERVARAKEGGQR